MEKITFSHKEKEYFWESLSLKLKEQLQYIESLKDTNPLAFLKERKLETLFQSNQDQTTPILVPLSSGFPPVTTQSLYIPVYIPSTSLPSTSSFLASGHILPKNMASIFSPLSVPAQLHDILQNYAQRIVTYNGEGEITKQQHLDMFNDFIDLEEADDDDVKLRLFAESFSSEVKNWFRSLPAGSITTFQNNLKKFFLRHGKIRKTIYRF